MKKKQKILIIALIVAIVLAVACLVTAILLKNRKPQQSTTAAGAVSTAQADDTATTVSESEAKGIEYVKEAYRADYLKIASDGIKGDPDAKIKAYFFNKAKDTSPELQMKSFNLLKVYEGFRIYDTTGTTNADGTKSYLLVVYAEDGKALIVTYESYSTTQERADLLTDYIEELDKNYERHAKYAKSLEGEDYILYE